MLRLAPVSTLNDTLFPCSTLFRSPCFWWMGSVANPALEAAAERAPVVVTGSKCSFDPFAKAQATACGKTLGELTRLGVPYRVVARGGTFDSVTIHIGGKEVDRKSTRLKSSH